MQGDAIVRDAERGVFVNGARASGTGNTFKTMCANKYALFLNLMLDLEDSLSQGSFFKDFMNGYNLLIKKAS